MRRKYPFQSLLLLALIVMLSFTTIFAANDESEQEALQHFLTIHEIEKELARIDVKEKVIQTELKRLEEKMEAQKENMANFRERANQVARAYYMGERMDLIMLIFSAESFSDFMLAYDYLSYILLNDEKKLVAYHHEYLALQEIVAEKEEQLIELDNLRLYLLQQKELREIVESELAVVMAGISDVGHVLNLQEQLILDWETYGVPAFKLFLETMSQSMAYLPAAFQDQITFSLRGTKLTISDEDFLHFLREQSPIFADFAITFSEEGLLFQGNYEDMTLSMSGIYRHNSPDHVSFEIIELLYNGFILPMSTVHELEEIYDLGIYPNQIINGLRVKELNLSSGKIEIVFYFNFN